MKATRKWVYSEWLMKAGDWDCTNAQNLNSAEAEKKIAELKAAHGQPLVDTTYEGEVVYLTWFFAGAKVMMVQQPCN